MGSDRGGLYSCDRLDPLFGILRRAEAVDESYSQITRAL